MASIQKKRKTEGSGKNCVVIGCSNSSKKLTRWKRQICEIHPTQIHEDCPCLQPYQMHRIPTGTNAVSEAKRRQWVKNINREGFIPGKYSSVCSIHFEEGRPTANHPYPTLAMGYHRYKKLSPVGPAPYRRIALIPALHPVAVASGGAERESNFEMDMFNEVLDTQQSMRSQNASAQWYDSSVADHNYARPGAISSVIRTPETRTGMVSQFPASAFRETTMQCYTGRRMAMLWVGVGYIPVFT